MRTGSVLVAIAAIVALCASSTSAASAKSHPAVSCRYSAIDHALRVTIRDEMQRIELPPGLPPHIRHEIRHEIDRLSTEPGSAAIELRGEQVTVLGGLQGPPVSCKGPAPTVTNTDSVTVALGKRSESADVLIDFLHGALAPGFTDEGDGSSEIEIGVDVGEGQVYVRGSREPDSVTVSANAGADATVDFGGPEASPDLAVARAQGMILDAVGGDDAVAVYGRPFELESGEGGSLIIGGQGSDTLAGGPGAEGLVPGPGVDSVDAGGGNDVVLTADRGRDRIDCGPGWDRLFATIKDVAVHSCERLRVAPFGALLGFSIELFIEESDYDDEVTVVSTSSVGKLLHRAR